MKFFLSDLGVVCALGTSREEIFAHALAGDTSGVRADVPAPCVEGRHFPFGAVPDEALPRIASVHENLRCNRLSLAALAQIRGSVERLKTAFPPERLGVVLGVSNTGVDEAQNGVFRWLEDGARPKEFDFSMLELNAPAIFLKKTLGFSGPALSISTACSSSVKAFASARLLLENDVCDAVLVGGTDAFCRFAANGFNALQSLDENLTTPLSRNRAGINLGEGAALFILEKFPPRDDGNDDGAARAGTTAAAPKIALLGIGESSDAFHLTAPHPQGAGAKTAMRAALDDANLRPYDIDFINLHGTGTPQNDIAESRAVFELFGAGTPCASTKPLTGHALGASGALAAALSWLMIRRGNTLIPHVFDGARDAGLAPIRLAQRDERAPVRRVLINSFAFGGSNACVILGVAENS